VKPKSNKKERKGDKDGTIFCGAKPKKKQREKITTGTAKN